MDSTLSEWARVILPKLGEIINSFSELLFAREITNLSFACIMGMALVLFSLSHRIPMTFMSEKIEKKIMGRKGYFREQEIKRMQAIRSYLKLLAIIDGLGVFYFVAFVLFLILHTFAKSPDPEETMQLSYVLISNSAFFCLFLPTSSITLYYCYFRIFRYRLH